MLEGSKLKIARANEHIADFHARMISFSKTDYYSLRVKKDPQSGHSIVNFSITTPVPQSTALIIGDAVHNLRSALDIAVCDIVFSATGQRSKWTKFPVEETREKLVIRMNGGTIRPASEVIANFIVDDIKPYKGGNDTICALHDLDILDKHMILLPVGQVSALIGVCAEDKQRGIILDRATFIVRDGLVLTPISVGGGELQITNYGKPAFDIVFGNGSALEGKSVIHTLKDLAKAVEGIVGAFETLLKP